MNESVMTLYLRYEFSLCCCLMVMHKIVPSMFVIDLFNVLNIHMLLHFCFLVPCGREIC